MAVLQRFPMSRSRAGVTALAAVTLAASLAACGDGKDADKAKQAAAAPPPPAVVVAEVVQKTVPIYSEFVAPDRRQGDGGDPRPGAGVPRGAALHRGHRWSRRTSCSSRSTSASIAGAARSRPTAKATPVESDRRRGARLGKAETDERRLKPLAERRAVPQQDYDNAAANLLAGRSGERRRPKASSRPGRVVARPPSPGELN